ncbi:MAG TPA: VOC family protein [Terriglobales bacterium]|nr:VOC family protein [Terriglobales bacterium]
MLLLLCCAPSLVVCAQQRPPITGVAYVTVITSDLERARQFYGKQLGLTEVSADDDRLPRALRFRINPRQYLNVCFFVKPPTNSVSRLYEVAFETPDAEALRRFLAANHIEVPASVDGEGDGSHAFRVKDPEGNRISFVQYAAGADASATQGIRSDKSGTPPPISSRMIHAGFVVHDRAAEDRFYHDLLGFRLYWQGGMKEDKTDWVDMQVPDGSDWLEYMLNVRPDASPRELGVVNHFALGVPKIEGIVDQLRARGWDGADRPQIGRDGKWQLNLYDPDLTRAEVMEFRPIRVPCCAPYSDAHPH